MISLARLSLRIFSRLCLRIKDFVSVDLATKCFARKIGQWKTGALQHEQCGLLGGSKAR